MSNPPTPPGYESATQPHCPQCRGSLEGAAATDVDLQDVLDVVLDLLDLAERIAVRLGVSLDAAS